MDLRGWDDRYRSAHPVETPTPLLIETAKNLKPGKALDLACGTGRNAIWLAEHGWQVTAVDGSPAAIEAVRRRPDITAQVADLEKGEYRIEPAKWDLIAVCYYLQRDLIESILKGPVPGGVVLMIVHIGEDATKHRLQPGELRDYFKGWEILHDYEGPPSDSCHHNLVAEIVAR